MKKDVLKKMIQTAKGDAPAQLVLKNAKVVDVFNGEIIDGDVAIYNGSIVGVGHYSGEQEVNLKGKYVAPGFIDSHIHIESAYVTPEEFGRLAVPHGTTTIVADPHEIVNVCGVDGMNYMLEAAKGTKLDIRYMVPSCVPSTPFEHAGAVLEAADMEVPMKEEQVLGLGEFMNAVGVVNTDDGVLDKLLLAHSMGKVIDGHSPGLTGETLNAYIAAGVRTDHECTTVEEMKERISKGMYVLLRQGSACHDLERLIPGITPYNSRMCLLCSDDRQPKTIFSEGHLESHLRMLVKHGIDAVTAVSMATINAARCYGLDNRGAIAPGYKADIVVLDDLESFHVDAVYIDGEKTAEQGRYLPEIYHTKGEKVKGRMNVKDFSIDKLRLPLKSDKVKVIDILPGGVVTGCGTAVVNLDDKGCFQYTANQDIVKVAVVERHNGTGNMAVGLIRGYGIKAGAVAVSVAHDSHNIIVVGVNDEDMATAVQELIKCGGGVILVKDGEVLENMPLPIAGLMSDKSGEWVSEQLDKIHHVAYESLGIKGDVEPVMTLCFMALPVIPELKITDMGLFDVTRFEFVPVEAD
ncbi:MAG: adenine deaminase [Lachnospiraceae bacterium]|nr:adenine deaminase [Lachnospiraceae bacterium]MDD3617406.1 adenine deaminase [Lachnospiraceae bacterium]